MKKKLLCFLVAVACVLPLILTGCRSEGTVSDVGTKPMTITLYGITGETTTEEAIEAVQEELNFYTEGKFNTHIVLKLYPESEYYRILDEKFADIERIKAEEEAEAKRKKDEAKALAMAGVQTKAETTAPETDAETYVEHGAVKTVYPAVKDTQLDIFMVRGAANLNKYASAGYLSSLSDALANSSKLLNRYISAELLTTATMEGTGLPSGLIDRGTVYGIPNNNVCGEYTYLLINKELANRYYYSADDVKTLATLANYLDDAAKHSDYITLYNEPTIMLEYLTDVPSLLGGVLTNSSNNFSRVTPMDMLRLSTYSNYLQSMYDFRKAGYITEGDYHSLPEGKKVAAAFLKGSAALPEQYKDEYYVVTYEMPVAHAADRPGTMFCVSSFAANVDRCMEIITALETVSSFRNTFQYGVENVNYQVDDYTGVVSILNDTYSMNPADTGNLFLLWVNEDMTPEMRALAENNWALAKQQYRDTITSPYAMFNFQIVTAENYKTTSAYYQSRYNAALDAAKKEAKANGTAFDEKSFVFEEEYPFEFTDTILTHLIALSAEYEEKINAFEEYTDEDGEVVTLKSYIKQLRKDFESDEYYQLLIDEENPDSPLSQYNTWYAANAPQLS